MSDNAKLLNLAADLITGEVPRPDAVTLHSVSRRLREIAERLEQEQADEAGPTLPG
jgi:hypothetical protein